MVGLTVVFVWIVELTLFDHELCYFVGVYDGWSYPKGTEYLGKPSGAMAKLVADLGVVLRSIPSPMDSLFRPDLPIKWVQILISSILPVDHFIAGVITHLVELDTYYLPKRVYPNIIDLFKQLRTTGNLFFE